QQYRIATQVPAVQAQGGETADRVGLEVVFQLRDQRQRIREIALEQRARVGGRGDRIEVRVVVARFGVQGHEQGDGEGALVVGQGDAHVAPARPDVQRVGLDAEAAVPGGRDLKLLVAV